MMQRHVTMAAILAGSALAGAWPRPWLAAAASCGLVVSGTVALYSCVTASLGTVIGPGVCIGAGAKPLAGATGVCLIAIGTADDAWLDVAPTCSSDKCN